MSNIRDYFDIRELVSREVYNKEGENAWRFFDPRLIELMLFIREEFNKSIYVNGWFFGKAFSQRGLRENTGSVVKKKTLEGKLYLSAHVFGQALDFDIKGMSAAEVRDRLVDMADRLPHPIRLEANVNWVHLDVAVKEGQGKVYVFNA
ncbi:MAG: hypothetical protein KAG64_07305 [Bacteroidales bacterium]|nr:hypothetical protein [Bacteroidales bacterium]